MSDMDTTPILKACHLVGGVTRMAAILQVKVPTVSQWVSKSPRQHRRVPAERCPAIERATGGQVRCEDLRPDVDWAVLRTDCERQKEAA